MLNRLKTAAQGGGSGGFGDGSSGSSSVDGSGKWGGRRGGGRPAERDQFRVQQQGFYVRGDLTVDVFQARGLRLGTAGERNPYCVVLVERGKVGETPTAAKTLSPVWNHPVKVPHESVRRAADANVWPVPYQPLSVQVWDRSNTSDTLLGTARIPITEVLGNGDGNGWYKLVGTGDQVGVEEVCGKIRVKVHWESETFASTPEDYPRLFLRDVFAPHQKDYQHLYYGGLCSTMLCPPAGEEVLLEMMLGVSRHDITANNHGKGVEGMLVLTELRLLFLPDIGAGSTTASFLDFNTVQVYLAAVRNFSHRGLEGGDRLLSITTRDGRFVHFRMPAVASAARCAAWFEAECPQHQQRRRRRGGGGGATAGAAAAAAATADSPGSGREELWKRGLWGAGSSELWMERLVDEIRWRKASGDFVALWHKLQQTSPTPRAAAIKSLSSAAAATATPTAGSSGGGAGFRSAPQYRHLSAIGAASTSKSATAAAAAAAAAAAEARGDLADGRAALERDLERVGVPAAGGAAGASSYAAFGKQMWELKPVNKDYALSPTYPQVLAFPSSITPAQLATAAPQRSRSRMPALVWLHPVSKAPLCRSSQPMAGMTTKVLSEDIHLLKQIRVTLDASKISIVDARSLLNAKANQVTGKGYEDVNDIGRDVCTLSFMGIENIHAVRDSLGAFCAASQAQGQEYYHAVGASGWLRHLSQIMKGAAFVVDELQRGVAVLVHCSDGWDRTAQLTALAQLYMDPYYRTLAGFEVLVEKEWCSFGHMFGLRAHSDSPTESSPVFLQWLDAVWQLVRQYPASFEFTGHYLERLVEGLYSAGFLNFAGNCERERKDKLKELQEAGSGALSIFAYLREHAMEGHIMAPLLNPLYRPPAQNLGGSGQLVPSARTVDILRPCCELQGLEVWQTVYMRDNLLLHHREQQLSVEQGLRLQEARAPCSSGVVDGGEYQTAHIEHRVYDFQRRMDLVEASMDRLPRGLKTKLQSSATGMSSPEWDQHSRLTVQLSADQDAAAAAAASGMASRGRSLSRNSRSGTHDDGSSRSRSRSFTLPLRGWGGGKGGGSSSTTGERRHRWASQDSDTHRAGRADTDTYRSTRVDTDIEEESYRAISEGSSRPQSSGGTSSGGGGGGAGVQTPGNDLVDVEGEEAGERPGRSKSFFGGFGRWGNGRLRSSSSAQSTARMPSFGDSGGEEGAAAAEGRRGSDQGAGGGGQQRRRNSSSSRNTRFSSFAGERPSVAPAMGPSPIAAEQPTSTVTFDPVPQTLNNIKPRNSSSSSSSSGTTKRGGGLMKRSNSLTDSLRRPSGAGVDPEEVPEPLQQARLFGGMKGWGRGGGGKPARRVSDSDAAAGHDGGGDKLRRLASDAGAGVASLAGTHTPRATATPGKIRWGRGRTTSSAGAEKDDEDLGHRRRALSTTSAGYGGAGASLTATPESRRSKSSSTPTSTSRGGGGGDAGGGRRGKSKKGVFKRTKGVFGSLQRTLGGGGSSNKPTPEASSGGGAGRMSPHQSLRQTPTSTPGERGGLGGISRSARSKSSARVEETKATGGERDGLEDAAASAERVAALLKAEEEAEARRQMQRTIVTLEMQLLVKDVVDTACMKAAERASSNQPSLKGPPLSASSSATHEPLSRLSGTAAQAEQKTFFGKFWSGGGGGGGGGDGGGGENSSDLDDDLDKQGARQTRRHSNVETGTAAIWRAGGVREVPPEKASNARDGGGGGKGRDGGGGDEGGEGFFQSLRKIFEGDKDKDKEKEKGRAGSSSGSGSGNNKNKSQRAVDAGAAAATTTPSEMPSSLRFTPVRAPDRSTNGSASGADGGRRGSGERTRRSQSMAETGAGAGAGPGTGGYSPIITIPPLPMAEGAAPAAKDPDAGAGGTRSAERSSSVDPSSAEAAAAKFGLVRMDYGKPES